MAKRKEQKIWRRREGMVCQCVRRKCRGQRRKKKKKKEERRKEEKKEKEEKSPL